MSSREYVESTLKQTMRVNNPSFDINRYVLAPVSLHKLYVPRQSTITHRVYFCRVYDRKLRGKVLLLDNPPKSIQDRAVTSKVWPVGDEFLGIS